MNLKEIREIIDLITEKGIVEFELERAGTRLRVSRVAARGAEGSAAAPAYGAPAAAMAAPGAGPRSTLPAAASIAPPGSSAPISAEEIVTIRSPMVGTFYSSPGQDAPPFVEIGDRVRVGQILCIIEAMKLMNEIEAEMEGEVAKCHVQNGQAVEFGEPLFDLRPAATAKKR
ncbi:MAG: acetyl-CoA carboxylase biotin carboxyl carrier protein [Acidobacteria bacterium]|nr:acetyl-CoA carboxylase biotin carboxyl carrier protein [Acidobacteriota bacterium]